MPKERIVNASGVSIFHEVLESVYSLATIRDLNRDWDKSIWHLAKGRYDFWLGSGDLFSSDSFLKDTDVLHLVEEKLGKDYEFYYGALTSEPGSEDGDWHTDAEILFDENTDSWLPPYYITLLVPLQDMSLEAGPTELDTSYLGAKSKYMPILKAGDALIMDGRVRHRGRANKTDSERRMLYIVFCKKWYDGDKP